jgi:hypothetical protein
MIIRAGDQKGIPKIKIIPEIIPAIPVRERTLLKILPLSRALGKYLINPSSSPKPAIKDSRLIAEIKAELNPTDSVLNILAAANQKTNPNTAPHIESIIK